MAVLAKVVGHVNGEFFSELENLYYTPNPSSFAIASFELAQKKKDLRTRVARPAVLLSPQVRSCACVLRVASSPV